MRRILGYSVALLGLSFLLLLFARLWNIAPRHYDVLVQLFLTLVLVLVGGLLLLAVRQLFFRELPALPRFGQRWSRPNETRS